MGEIRVLHVDDQADFAEMAAEFLHRQDNQFTVETATSTEQAISILTQSQIDCVISDYDMPDQNGIEFLESVRELHPDIPFILFTGKGSEEIASDAISAGVTDYFQKHVGPDQYTVIAHRIENAVAARRATTEAERMATYLEQIKQNVTDVVWITSPTTDEIRFISDSYKDVWGRTPESLLEDPHSFVDAIHPDDRDRVREAVQKHQQNPDDYEEIYRVVQPDGTVRWVNDSSAGIHENGELTGIVGVATDITDLKESQLSLQQEQAFTESALRIAVDFYWGIDLDGIVTRWSDTDAEVTGYTEAEAIGLHTSTFHPDDHFPRIADAIEEMIDTGSVVVEADLLTKHGERIPFEFAGTVITDEAGEIRSMCGVGRDISNST